MGTSIKCNTCGAPASVHLTQIINTKIHKVDLCEPCAQEKGVTDGDSFSLADFLTQSLLTAKGASEKLDAAPESLACPDCALTIPKFKKTGRLGCASCYEHLLPIIETVLQGMHKGMHHKGKIPQHSVNCTDVSDQIVELTAKLNLAVKEERYEDAACHRDEIQRMKTQFSTT